MRLVWLLVMVFAPASVAADDPAFEAASVKVTPKASPAVLNTGGAGTSDPGQLIRRGSPLYHLVAEAYRRQDYELSTPPWLQTERYDVTAKVPAGTTKAQQRIMLRNLLIERFHLTVHHEKKEMAVVELVIAKGGSKLKPADPAAQSDEEDGVPHLAKVDAQGYPIILEGWSTIRQTMKATMRGKNEDIVQLASHLRSFVHQPVVDGTGLSGTYDYTLHWVSDEGPGGSGPTEATTPEGGPTLFAALQSQLGLKLEAKKAMIDVLVVDRADKVPTGN